MEQKSQHLIFVGYIKNVKAYSLFDPNSREVYFDGMSSLMSTFQQ